MKKTFISNGEERDFEIPDYHNAAEIDQIKFEGRVWLPKDSPQENA